MRGLIADDEKLARSSLRSTIEGLNLPLEIVGEAQNGEETLTLLKEHQPDIAFVDIRMPKLNGLEAIKYGKHISAHTQWIILTGFSEFNYAQKAVQLGAINYFLKPVNPIELEQSLNSLLQQNKQYLMMQNEHFENEIIASLQGLSPLNNHDLENARTRYACSTFFIDSYMEETSKAKRLKGFSNEIRKYIQQELTSEVRMSLFLSPSGHLATLGAWGFMKGTESEGKTIINQYFNKVAENLLKRSCRDFSVTVIQSEETVSIEDLPEQLDLIEELSSLRAVLGIRRKWKLTEY